MWYMEYLVGRSGGKQNDPMNPILTLIGEAGRVPEKFRRAVYLHLVASVKTLELFLFPTSVT